MPSLEFEYSGVMLVYCVENAQQLVTRRVAVADIWLLSRFREPWVTHGRLIVACGRRCGVVALRVLQDTLGVLVSR